MPSKEDKLVHRSCVPASTCNAVLGEILSGEGAENQRQRFAVYENTPPSHDLASEAEKVEEIQSDTVDQANFSRR